MQNHFPVRVLVIDNSLTTCKVLEIGLRRAGYQVLCYQDPKVALSFLLRKDTIWPHVLLLDLLLPELDGFEVLEELQCRCPDAFASLTSIILSSRNHRLYRQEALDLGAKEYVLKPFVLEEIIQLIEIYTSPYKVSAVRKSR
jgi:DNA-binding response OmpR family regulator